MKKAIKMCIEFDDGTVSFAEGDHANEVWTWRNQCESHLILIRNWEYNGTPLINKPKEESPLKKQKCVHDLAREFLNSKEENNEA